jgi:hypothetical protein
MKRTHGHRDARCGDHAGVRALGVSGHPEDAFEVEVRGGVVVASGSSCGHALDGSLRWRRSVHDPAPSRTRSRSRPRRRGHRANRPIGPKLPGLRRARELLRIPRACGRCRFGQRGRRRGQFVLPGTRVDVIVTVRTTATARDEGRCRGRCSATSRSDRGHPLRPG